MAPFLLSVEGRALAALLVFAALEVLKRLPVVERLLAGPLAKLCAATILAIGAAGAAWGAGSSLEEALSLALSTLVGASGLHAMGRAGEMAAADRRAEKDLGGGT